ncbi:MAG: hypothetical protein ACM3ZR_11935 [Pseudomonadota bacterium]
MDKRTDNRKRRSREFAETLKRIAGIAFCVALLVFSINAADISTRRMMMITDDRYALAVTMEERGVLRVDIVGEKYLFNIMPVISLVDEVAADSRNCCERLIKAIKDKTGS